MSNSKERIIAVVPHHLDTVINVLLCSCDKATETTTFTRVVDLRLERDLREGLFCACAMVCLTTHKIIGVAFFEGACVTARSL